MGVLKAVAIFLRAVLVPKARLSIENLTPRQQLAVCRQSIKRPKLRARDLNCRMSRENPIWEAPRILSELRLLGYDVAESTVAKYMVRQR